MRKNAAAQADLAISWEKERPAARFFCDATPPVEYRLFSSD
jgi:hypothetical protein